MSAHLTTRQSNELNAAILDYLSSNSDFPNACAAFKEEAGLSDAPSATGRERGLLVKKWNSVIRLSKQVSDLKAKMAHMVESDGLSNDRGHTSNGERRNLPLQQQPATIMNGHRDRVTCVRSHPKFGLVASSSDDSTIKVWDAESGTLEASLIGHSKSVSHIAFDASGDLLASCSADMAVKIWSMSSKQKGQKYKCSRTMLGHDHTVSAVEFLVAASNRVVSCSRDKTIKVWDISSGYCLVTLLDHRDWIRALAVSPHGNLIASGGNDQTILVWRLSESTKGTLGEVAQRLDHHTHFIQTIAFASTAFKTNASNEESASKDGAVSSSGRQEIMLLASGGRDNTICVWNLSSGELAFVLDDHLNWINDLFFHPSGKYLLSAADDRSIRVFDLHSRRCLRSLDDAHEHFVTSLTMCPQLGRLFSGGVDMQVRGWLCR